MEENILNKKESESQLEYFKRITDNRKELDLDYSEWVKLLIGKEYSSENARKGYYIVSKLLEVLEEEQLKVLKNALLKYTKVPSEILKTNDDVSIILSAMVTLATDNAKELALAKLHASLNLASMHTYLISMGVPFNEVVDYTAKSKIFTDLYNLTKADSWSGLKGKLTSSVWKQL